MLETGVTVAGSFRGCGVDFRQITENCFDRGVQAIKIKTIETYFGRTIRKRSVVVAQPLDKIEHDPVAPHPGRKPLETSQCFISVSIVAETAHVAVSPKGIRPIGFDRNRGEAFLFY